MEIPIGYEPSQKFLDDLRRALQHEYNKVYFDDELKKIATDLIHAFATVM